MNWYSDPAGTAAKITAAVTAVLTLIVAIVAFARGAGTLDVVLSALGPAIAGVLAVVAMLRGRQDSIAPQTLLETPNSAIRSAEETRNAHS